MILHSLSRLRWRILCLAALPLCASPALAQSLDPPPCPTNSGTGGLLFYGGFGTINPPIAYDSVQASNDAIEILDVVESDLGLIVFPVERPPSDAEPGTGPSTVFRFTGNSSTYSCTATVVAFEPDRHDIARAAIGSCDFHRVAGHSALLTGHTQVLEIKAMPDEWAGDPQHIMYTFVLDYMGGPIFAFFGISPGFATWIWLRDNNVGGICPFLVQDPDPASTDRLLAEMDLCRDIDDRPLSIKAGDIVTLPMDVYRYNLHEFSGKLGHANLPIELTSAPVPVRNADQFEIWAREPGTTTLITAPVDGGDFGACLVVID
ncbi:MAG: hypothetical protein AAGE76_10075 [Pseudomonadota bacterium]